MAEKIYRSFGCAICGKQSPKKLWGRNMFQERMRWLWRHRKENHPWHFARSEGKAQRTKASKKKLAGKK